MNQYFEWRPVVDAFCSWTGFDTDVNSPMEVMTAIYITKEGLLIQGVSEEHQGISYEIRIDTPIDPARHNIVDLLNHINLKTGWLVNTPEELQNAKQYMETTYGVMIICRYSRMIVPLFQPVR